MCLNINMSIQTVLTYLKMIPMIVGVLSMLVIAALLGSTVIASIVIGIGEWISS